MISLINYSDEYDLELASRRLPINQLRKEHITCLTLVHDDHGHGSCMNGDVSHDDVVCITD